MMVMTLNHEMGNLTDLTMTHFLIKHPHYLAKGSIQLISK